MCQGPLHGCHPPCARGATPRSPILVRAAPAERPRVQTMQPVDNTSHRRRLLRNIATNRDRHPQLCRHCIPSSDDSFFAGWLSPHPSVLHSLCLRRERAAPREAPEGNASTHPLPPLVHPKAPLVGASGRRGCRCQLQGRKAPGFWARRQHIQPHIFVRQEAAMWGPPPPQHAMRQLPRDAAAGSAPVSVPNPPSLSQVILGSDLEYSHCDPKVATPGPCPSPLLTCPAPLGAAGLA
jgi:hypothetical protein